MLTDAPAGASVNMVSPAPHDDLRAVDADPFRRLVRQAGHLLWTASADGLADAEESWCPYTGQRPDEAMGWGWLTAIHPDDRERTREAWMRALADQAGYEVEQRIRRADGVYRTFLTRGMPIPSPHGHAQAWAVFAADITPRAEAAAALRVSEERLRTVVANVPIVLFAVDRDGIFTLSEGRGLEALGIAPDAHVGQSYFALYGELADSVATMRRALAGEAATTVERFKGLVFETRWTPTRDASGAVTGVIGISADITARAQAEEERARAAEQAATLAATFDVITDGILVYDRDAHLLHANMAAYETNPRLAGPAYQQQDFYERAALAAPRDVEGHSLPKEQWPVSRVLRGEVLTGPEAVDTLVRRPDGHDVLLSVSGAPIRDAEGRIVGGVIVNRDVTERRRLERRTRAALDALLEMAQAMVEVPGDGHDATASALAIAHRLGLLMREVLGCRSVGLIAVSAQGELRPLDCAGLAPDQLELWRKRIVHWPRRTALFAALSARLRSGETIRIDTTQPEYREIANPFEIEHYLLAPMRVGATLVGLLSVDYGRGGAPPAADDVALVEAMARLAALVLERERLLRERAEARTNELALRTANRRMDEFLSVASHELRTPLTGLRGSLQVMQRRLERAAGGSEPSSAAELATALSRLAPFLERALRQSNVLAGLVEDLLDLSRIRAGQLQLRLALCDLVALVRQTVEEQHALEPSRSIGLLAPPGPLWVHADAERLAQVVAHFVANAFKYSTPAQHITVTVMAEGAMARVRVRDEGPGIAAAEQERIWDRFYRVEGSGHRSGSSVGLGLGLYISRTIVERHHGQVGVESAPGAGATFWLAVPLAAPAMANEGAGATPPREYPPSEPHG